MPKRVAPRSTVYIYKYVCEEECRNVTACIVPIHTYYTKAAKRESSAKGRALIKPKKEKKKTNKLHAPPWGRQLAPTSLRYRLTVSVEVSTRQIEYSSVPNFCEPLIVGVFPNCESSDGGAERGRTLTAV